MIPGLLKLALLYVLVLGGGHRIASRLPPADILERWLMTAAFGFAQLLATIQLLSLFHRLGGYELLLTNAAITAITFAATRSCPAISIPCRLDAARAAAFFRAHPLSVLLLAVAVASVIGSAGAGMLIYPMTDIYHYTMPLFWKQHASMLPFPCYDPRLIGVVFGSEGVCFPGFLYLNSGAICAWVTGLGALMSIWIVTAIARRLGASMPATLSAGALLAGFGPVSTALFGAMADMILPAMWFGGSVYFLLGSRDHGEINRLKLGCSLLCLMLACATKNIVLLQAPSWLLIAFLWHGRQLFSWKAVGSAAAWGVPALLASGFVWSYASNLRWYGTIKGGRELQETVSTELHPRAVWTRIARGVVTITTDVIWLPQRFRESYASMSVSAVKALGGLEQLNEDRGFYSFTIDGPRPGRAMGPLGFAFLVPGVLAGFTCLLPHKRGGLGRDNPWKLPVGLGLLTVGSFATCYVVMRWQCIGLNRMMLSCVIAGLPLSALLLERRTGRIIALVLMTICLGMYGVSGLGSTLRRLDLRDRNWVASKITRLQADHSFQADYRWHDGTAGSLTVREDYTRREFYELVFSRLKQPSVVGLIGSFNTEGYYAFGPDYSNRVVSLIDSRAPEQIIKPAPEVGFIIVELQELAGLDRAMLPEFETWLEVTRSGKPVFLVLKRRAAQR